MAEKQTLLQKALKLKRATGRECRSEEEATLAVAWLDGLSVPGSQLWCITRSTLNPS
jgi:hypothetical protein